MTGENKILTVSYGTFSCTLEGFDDPFSAMRSIAEYFRDLAADDRFFGAEPPTPDVEMLHRIAERQIEHRVEAQVKDDGIVLRQMQKSPSDEAPAGDETAASGETSYAEPQEPEAPAGAPEANEAMDNIAEKLRRIRAVVAAAPAYAEENVDKAEDAPLRAAVEAEDEQEADEEEIETESFDDFSEMPEDDYAEPEAFEEEEEEAVAEAPAADFEDEDDFEEPEAEELTAEEEEIPSFEPETLVSEEIEEDVFEAEEEEETASEADDESILKAFRAGFLSEPAVEEEETPEADDDDGDADDALSAAIAASRFEEEDEDEASFEMAEADEDDEPDFGDDFEEPDFGDDFKGSIFEEEDEEEDMPMSSAAAFDDLDEDDDDTGFALDDEQETLEEDEDEVAAFDDEEVDEDAVSRAWDEFSPDRKPEAAEAAAPKDNALAARIVQLKRAMGAPEEEEPTASLDDDEEDWDEDGEDMTDDWEDEDEKDEFAFDPSLLDEDEQLPEIDMSSDEDNGETVFEKKLRKAEEVAEQPKPKSARERLSSIVPDEFGDAAFDRILEQTNSQLDDTESARRRSAIAHLKAAVAATKADRMIHGQPTDEEEEAEVQSRYREDLAKVVRPRRGEEDKQPREQAAAGDDGGEAAPLMLVSELRVTRQEGREAASASVRPKRAHLTEEDEDDELGGDIAEDSNFSEFADKMGATELPDLMEAAAAYAAFVEGQKEFSRPEIMRRVASFNAGTDFTREAGLRSFGQLLREGKIRKLKRGQFTIPEQSRFNPEARIAGE